MIFLVAFLLELIFLFFLARALTRHFTRLLYRFGFSEKQVMHTLAFLFLPGTFIHETSHYLMCVILRVKVFGMGLFPKPMGNNMIKMGTLEHAQTNFFFDLIIGAGPFIFGNLILFLLLFYFTSRSPLGFNWLTLFIGLAVFEIGNTMFSSKKDMEGSFKFLLILTLITSLVYFLGFRVSVEQLYQSLPSPLIPIIRKADIFLLLPIFVDILVIGLVHGIINLNDRR